MEFNKLKIKIMKFTDKIERTSLEEVFVIRTTEEMEAREEYNSNN